MADTAETTEKAKLINDIVNMEWDFASKALRSIYYDIRR